MIQTEHATVFIGNNLETLKDIPDNSVDSIVTDPPYGLSDNKFVAETITRWIQGERDFIPDGKGFMGKAWDAFVPPPAVWDECLRVLKPGGHLLAFFGSRTQDIGALSIRLAGFEIRDSIAWMYGSGFPKSLDVSKAIDKEAGAEREVVGKQIATIAAGQGNYISGPRVEVDLLGPPATPEAKQWEGWGTALKPAFEPIVVARKPLIGTVAENVLTHGTGALNIDGSRIGTEGGGTTCNDRDLEGNCIGHSNANTSLGGGIMRHGPKYSAGRWPTNVILDEYSAELLDEQSDASRFFYVAKASKADRNEGLEGLPEIRTGAMSATADGSMLTGSGNERTTTRQNFHPTVKPTTLMTYLVKLVTPPGGTVLDPFTGSGSTGKAAILEGFTFIGCELTEDYIPIIEGRLKHAEQTRAENLIKESEGLF